MIFPDNDSVESLTGGFKSAKEFRDFLCNHQGRRVEHQFFTRPTKNRKQDYLQDEFVRAMPLQFPYGFGPFSKLSVLSDSYSRQRRHLNFEDSLRFLLRHNRLEFHNATFNLFANDRIMKANVFSSARLQCNLRYQDSQAMGEKFGTMKSSKLSEAIDKARSDEFYQNRNEVADSFLKSVNAICSDLPHTNEASVDAKSKYFSYLVKFGLPALFVTISPDDERSVWISVYALNNCEKLWHSEPTTEDLSDEYLLTSYKKRCKDRIDFPGLCAEAYIAIVESFIKDFLGWNDDHCKSMKTGYFGYTEAFTLATEEQGRKSLHGHFLIWLKGWNDLLHRIMEGHIYSEAQQQTDLQELKTFVKHCSSATVFQDFQPEKEFEAHPPFKHDNCRNSRNETRSRYTVNAVDQKQLCEMRHKRKCYEHRGNIAMCPKCGEKFSIQGIIKNGLQHIDGSAETKYHFPDDTRRLEQLVFEMEKDFDWISGPPRKKAKRLFATNCHSNIHRVHHSTRCFKNQESCYANLPQNTQENLTVVFNQFPSVWCDWKGIPHEKRIFEVRHQRKIEDVYTNVHNKDISQCYLCNNNVACAMTGSSVLYCTCYNTKQTQKEEKKAYENLAKTMLKVLEMQVSPLSCIV